MNRFVLVLVLVLVLDNPPGLDVFEDEDEDEIEKEDERPGSWVASPLRTCASTNSVLLLILARPRGITLSTMNKIPLAADCGRVASLHLHPAEPGAPLESVDSIE